MASLQCGLSHVYRLAHDFSTLTPDHHQGIKGKRRTKAAINPFTAKLSILTNQPYLFGGFLVNAYRYRGETIT